MSGLICAFEACRRPAAAGLRVEVRLVEGREQPFGPGIRGYPLEDADGPLVSVYHTRCWWAQVKRVRLLRARAADPSGQSGPARDWREPETCDVEALRGGLDGDYRGAGTAPD